MKTTVLVQLVLPYLVIKNTEHSYFIWHLCMFYLATLSPDSLELKQNTTPESRQGLKAICKGTLVVTGW